MNKKRLFSFGKNWQVFLKRLNEDKIKYAKQSLIDFLGINDLQGKSFLDIGCGSGIFSYAAFNLGAKKIVSFDPDPLAVECCKHLHDRTGKPKNWEIYEGSIIDRNFISKLGKFDIVYAWGVLHHTGKMWEAIKNSANIVASGGYYYIAIYNKVEGILGSKSWLKLKKIYNFTPEINKYIFPTVYMFLYFIINLIGFKNPVRNINNYSKLKRGMDWQTDIFDRMGAYPYEFATIEEIFNFIKSNFPNFILINIKSTNYLGNNWYLFKNDKTK